MKKHLRVNNCVLLSALIKVLNGSIPHIALSQEHDDPFRR